MKSSSKRVFPPIVYGEIRNNTQVYHVIIMCFRFSHPNSFQSLSFSKIFVVRVPIPTYLPTQLITHKKAKSYLLGSFAVGLSYAHLYGYLFHKICWFIRWIQFAFRQLNNCVSLVSSSELFFWNWNSSFILKLVYKIRSSSKGVMWELHLSIKIV